MKGRKRHIVVNTQDLLLAVAVHPAHIQDPDGAKLVLGKPAGRSHRVRVIWADAAYAGRLGIVGPNYWGLGVERGAAAAGQPQVGGAAPPVGGGTHPGAPWHGSAGASG